VKRPHSLVTGGSGFIGSHLCEKLISLNHKVTVIDNFEVGKRSNLLNISNKVKIYKRDIRSYKKIEKLFKNVDYVFHLAALADIVPSIENPTSYYETNVTGTLNVLKASIKFKVKKLIYTASSSSYGIPKKYPTPESSEIKPEYPYALTKRLGEEIVMHFGKIYNLNVTSLRFFNVYGPRARTSGTYGAVFGVFLAQKLNNKPLTIVGDGKQKRDFTYVSDIINAFITVLKNKKTKNEIFNVGSGKTVSVNKIVDLMKVSKIVKIPKRPGEPFQTFADISKIKKITGWRPKTDIEKGISIMLKNILDWKKAPLWTPKKIKIATKSWFKYLK
jgi:UDP-glucose 4-epimerase